MSDFEDKHFKLRIIDQIDDAVISLSDPVFFLARKFLASMRPRIFSQIPDIPGDFLKILLGKSIQLFDRRRLDQDFISCHGL